MTNTNAEFGDFQTPLDLAMRVCRLLATQGCAPKSVLEPTCGTGGFLEAASKVWPRTELSGVEINSQYVDEATKRLEGKGTILNGDFFTFDWNSLLNTLAQPISVIGNLPWVTNATLGSLGSTNLPKKSNFQNRKGFDAITGKANFDISEWMLIHMLNWFTGHNLTLALLCKTAVARKVLVQAWKQSIFIQSAIFKIDAKKEFNVAVDACLLFIKPSQTEILDCPVFCSLDAIKLQQIIGYRQKHLVAEINFYKRTMHLIGSSPFKWRSGIKHDCAKIMEFDEDEDGKLINNLGETVDLERTFLYPMLKSSCIANGRVTTPRKWMLVTQQFVNQSTAGIAEIAPKTWSYLMRHQLLLQKRSSSIYKDKPAFSIFGIGDYSFAPWKVAISGFYHSLNFQLIKTHAGKPIVLDDTINFLPCDTEEQAEILLRVLNSTLAREFFKAFVFWDAKRPITTEILQKLNLIALAEQLEENLLSPFHKGTKEFLFNSGLRLSLTNAKDL